MSSHHIAIILTLNSKDANITHELIFNVFTTYMTKIYGIYVITRDGDFNLQLVPIHILCCRDVGHPRAIMPSDEHISFWMFQNVVTCMTTLIIHVITPLVVHLSKYLMAPTYKVTTSIINTQQIFKYEVHGQTKNITTCKISC